ncbi:MAG: amidohydrolase [Lachnospiraceae bacterium]|nr:amidohydrolase [Lachnospiraceae bacterium]
MTTRFYNAKILTMSDDGDPFDGELWTEGARIAFVGTADEAERKKRESALQDGIRFADEIDCEGNLLMPGFKNAHTHSAMTLLRSRADDLPLDQWLNEQIFPVEARLTEEDIYHLTKLAFLEYLTSGITACFDMYLTPRSIARAASDAGFRMVQVGAVNNFSQSPELVEEMYRELNGKDAYNSYVIGFHAEYTCSRELLEKIAALADRLKAPVFTHISETKGEVAGCKERYGMTPVAFLDSLGMFAHGGGGYHLVHVTDEDIRILKDRGMFVVTNPGSNTKLASGIAPISKYLAAGVPVAIGTDGPASNNALDMFREMFLVTGLAKLKDDSASSVDASEVLKMATVNGARAMGLNDCDVLAEGKKADLILIDLHAPNMQPVNNIRKNLVYSGSKSNVKLTMIEGKVKYRDGSFFIGGSPDDIYAKATEIKERIDREMAGA